MIAGQPIAPRSPPTPDCWPTAVGLTDLAGAALSEFHWGKNTRHSLAGVLCQSVFGRLAGHENVNDDDRLAHAVLLGSRPR
jgi:hypothetical protein